jgi:hypothetical protein
LFVYSSTKLFGGVPWPHYYNGFFCDGSIGGSPVHVAMGNYVRGVYQQPATYYKKKHIWATPWEITHGELFPDSSIVVPFGCAALIKLMEDEREKFKSTCAMVIFIHYALDHPLYTYAFYSRGSCSVKTASFFLGLSLCERQGHALDLSQKGKYF